MAVVRLLLLLLLLLLLSFMITPSLSITEAEALLKLKNSFQNNQLLSSWAPESSPCKNGWAGVLCTVGIVTGLRLKDMSLSGMVDIDALLQLSGLRTLSLENNNFTGPIPEFNRIGVLKAIFLSHNQFSDEIPSDYFSGMLSLKRVFLDNNHITGNVPESLAKLPNLMELHLENNQFSGNVPSFEQPNISLINLSNNKLNGEIPGSLSRFNASSFAGNEGLCGEPIGKVCTAQPQGQDSPPAISSATSARNGSLNTGLVAGFIVAAMVVIFLVAILSKKRKQEDFRVLEKENNDEVVEVRVSAANRSNSRRNQESSRKGDSRKGSAHGKNAMGDLVMVNEENGIFGFPDLMKASAEVLGNGGLGSAYKATLANGLSVVVKRIREMNRLGKDSFDAEMSRMGRLRHPNILTPLAYNYRREEKLLVSEYVPRGSLLYVLHGDRGSSHAELSWPVRLKIIQGIARGMGFLYSEFDNYDLPHGNLKSSNVLLGLDYEPLLSDYAFQPLTNPDHATQGMFAYKSPEYTQFQQISRKSDVYCLGVVILELLTGKFPCQYLSAGKGGTDVVEWVRSAVTENREAELIDPEIASSTNSLNQMVQLLRVGNDCTESNLNQRPDMNEAIRRIQEVRV